MSDEDETFEDFCDDIIVHDDVEDGDLDFTFTELKEEEKKMCTKCGFWFTVRNLDDGGMCSRCAHLARLNHEWRAWAEEETTKEDNKDKPLSPKNGVTFSNDLVTFIPRNVLKSKDEVLLKEDPTPITLLTTTVITLITNDDPNDPKSQLISTESTAPTILSPATTTTTEESTTTGQLIAAD
eukprot:TRINITY_DN2400_c0_g2_i5.p1 TRINITY_DN2400_c0_g2~~TRINITY_DN2400_c0_g2_i5.p1  ORF type:complete len:182 (-),score=47.66 TRINITY_DN2400_c0_g2_i5:491-1036(-)